MDKIIKSFSEEWNNLYIFKNFKAYFIKNETDQIKMYFYCYFGYFKEFKQYKLPQFKNYIMKSGNIYLMATISGQIKFMRYLEKQDPKIFNIYNKSIGTKYTPYLMAVIYGNKKMMKYLEKRGSNIYSTDYINNNSYLLAIKFGQLKIVKYLDKVGKVGNKINYCQENAYLIAINNSREIFKYINKKYQGLNRKNYLFIKNKLNMNKLYAKNNINYIKYEIKYRHNKYKFTYI